MIDAMPHGDATMFGKWIFAAAILVMPTYALAQVQSGVQSGVQTGVQGGVRSGFDHDNSGIRYGRARAPVPYYSQCWRTTVTRGKRIVWNCQPYPPPSP
ncbi:MAG: hypothetical protein WB540_18290 [Pseudolabrys sp.]|jgi:hypothetical protein